MGVLGLWQILQPTGRPTKLQVFGCIRQIKGSEIKPIFVFDGPNVPKLKQRVLKERQRRRNAAADKAKSIQDQIEKKILESHILKKVTASGTESSVATTSKSTQNQTSDMDDLFMLKDNPNFLQPKSESDDENKEMETDASHYEHIDLEDMDPSVFESLPDDVKFDILLDQKQRLREKKSLNFDEFPQKYDEFSDYQMGLLLKKSSVSNKINELKKNIKSQFSTGTNFDDLYHQKVASEADSEVILFTKKFINKFTAKNILDEIHSQKKEDLEEENIFFETKNEPSVRIEFNANNKIELISNPENVKNDEADNEKIEEKYIKIDDNSLVEEKLVESDLDQSGMVAKPENNETNDLTHDKINKIISVQEYNLINEHSGLFKEDNLAKDVDQKKIEASKDQEIVKIHENININLTVPEDNLIDDHSGLSKEDNLAKDVDQKKIEASKDQEMVKIHEINDETDDDDDDDFVEVKENETELIKEMVEFEKIQILSQNQTQELNESQSDIPIEVLNEIQENLEPEKGLDMEQIEIMNSNLIQDTNRLIKEKELNDRLSGAVERHIIDDAKILLQLFGLPYIQSPGEAEAQCAFLDYTSQTDGSITEDSDVWLFGGKKVYKNFFGTDQFIDFYSDSVIKSQIGLDREALIDIALLVGSDYTEGVENVGIVKAVEILNEFEGNGLEKLKNLKEWQKTTKNLSKKSIPKIRQAFLKLNLSESFPSEVVYNAYINPDIDKSTDEFSWSMPDLDSIRKFLIKKMNWSMKKIDDDLLPIMRRLNETKVQKTLDTFFFFDRKSSFSKQSKRMKKAISMYRSKSDVSGTKSKELNLSEDEEMSQSQNSKNSRDPDIVVLENEPTSNKRKSSESNLNNKTKKQSKSPNKRSNTK
ncbi:DNA repair complementing XP-G cells [Brachionus plicatilis]|uniref:DNA repair complementing XP-G cells n=1 Tax=Brachionus plicatilis TaxID=10195 RepID=A0A3M7S7Z9_BRAPC|nr:DNA repair complementing XP-G cells [Brachionus plicatilis]